MADEHGAKGVRVGIVLDSWKLSYFTRHLMQADFSFETGAGITDDTTNLYVETEEVARLREVILAANTEAQESRSKLS